MSPKRITLIGSKVCKRCRENKPDSEYYPNPNRPGLLAICKECNVKRGNEWKARNRERVNEQQRQRVERRRYTDDAERRAARRRIAHNCDLRRKYGITIDEFDALLAEQGGKCAICGAASPGARVKHFNVDHCHETGRVRGLLCFRCNGGLGSLGDTVEALERAIAYLKRGG